MTRDQVYELCKRVAPGYGFDPLLALALCEQESGYDEKALRMENGFLHKYVLPLGYDIPTSLCSATSYGLSQVMGLNLVALGKMTRFNMLERVGQYLHDPEEQLQSGLRHLAKQPGSLPEQLFHYNGSRKYPPEVLARYAKLKKELG
jgi:hypothetical protein